MFTEKAKLSTFINKDVREEQRRHPHFRRLLLLLPDLYARVLCTASTKVMMDRELHMTGHFLSDSNDRRKNVTLAFEKASRVVMEVWACGADDMDLGVDIAFMRGSKRIYEITFCYKLENGIIGAGQMGTPEQLKKLPDAA